MAIIAPSRSPSTDIKQALDILVSILLTHVLINPISGFNIKHIKMDIIKIPTTG